MRLIKCLAIVLIAALALPAFLPAGSPINEYTRAIETSPEDMKYKFYLLRGRAYKDLGEMNFALNDFDTAIMFHPSIIAYKYRGEVYFEMKRYDDAVVDFTKALEINPTIELFKKRGESYLQSANYVLALADGLNIIDMEPYTAKSYYISIEALENLGDIKLARKMAFEVMSFDKYNKKANEIITKYPMKFLFIGEGPFAIYVSQENVDTKNKANEIFLKYKNAEELDEFLKYKLAECSIIGKKITLQQKQLEEIWDNYFGEVRSLKVRSKKIHDSLRKTYLKKGGVIESQIDIWENKSKKCTEEMVKAYWNNKQK